jgi:hypothetical protein
MWECLIRFTYADFLQSAEVFPGSFVLKICGAGLPLLHMPSWYPHTQLYLYLLFDINM